VGVPSDSHTTPITIAAEQGTIGLLAYVALLAAALLTLARGPLRSRPVRVAILAAFVALVVHTWAYADFLEDPITWTLLAVGTVLARE
jgi:O-antigen ligase